MKRKINRVGPNTLTVSLPSKWAKKYGIKQGDEIDVNEEGPCLNICVKRNEILSSVTVDFDSVDYEGVKSHPNLFRTIIGNLYKRGYDEIKVNFSENMKLKDIQKRMDLLLGYEIISSSKHNIMIKSILNGNPSEFESIFKKFFQIILNKSKEIEESLKNGNILADEDISEFRATIEKLSDFLLRLNTKDTIKDINTIKQDMIIVMHLEKLGREYVHLYDYIINTGATSLGKSVLVYLNDVNNYLEALYKHYYSFQLKDSYALASQKNNMIFKKGYSILKECKKNEVIVVHHLMNIVRRAWDVEGPLISLQL